MAFAMYGRGVMMAFTRSVHVSAFPFIGESRLCFVVPLTFGERLRDFTPVSIECRR